LLFVSGERERGSKKEKYAAAHRLHLYREADGQKDHIQVGNSYAALPAGPGSAAAAGRSAIGRALQAGQQLGQYQP
jgi:hypothetical protein